MKSILSAVVELLGLALLVFGIWTFDWRAGVIVAGLVVTLIGFAIDGPVTTGPSR